MIVASLGNSVFFEVSESTAQMIQALTWSSSANYSVHKLASRKGIIEFTGTNPEEITFEVELSAFLGTNPKKMLNAMTIMHDRGIHGIFILGTDQIGSNPWVIASIDREAEYYYRDGTVLAYKVKIKLMEDPQTKSIGTAISARNSGVGTGASARNSGIGTGAKARRGL